MVLADRTSDSKGSCIGAPVTARVTGPIRKRQCARAKENIKGRRALRRLRYRGFSRESRGDQFEKARWRVRFGFTEHRRGRSGGRGSHLVKRTVKRIMKRTVKRIMKRIVEPSANCKQVVPRTRCSVVHRVSFARLSSRDAHATTDHRRNTCRFFIRIRRCRDAQASRCHQAEHSRGGA